MKSTHATGNTILDSSFSTITYHHHLSFSLENSPSYTWEMTNASLFNELIISWNAQRPQYGELHFNISLKIQDQWTPYLPYAAWGSVGQKGSVAKADTFPITISQDLLEIGEGKKASGFRIQIEVCNGAQFADFYSLHACASVTGDFLPEAIASEESTELSIPLISQMKLIHPRNKDMCSAASTASLVSFLLQKNRIDPVCFAMQSHDEDSNIFGNWVLNVAYAWTILGRKWHCWVQRLKGFKDIQTQLKKNIPVVVSIKGPLSGSALTYSQGHLLVVKGYDHKQKKVLCMDPAFAADELTDVSYDLQDFIDAWARRGCIAYVFEASL